MKFVRIKLYYGFINSAIIKVKGGGEDLIVGNNERSNEF